MGNDSSKQKQKEIDHKDMCSKQRNKNERNPGTHKNKREPSLQ